MDSNPASLHQTNLFGTDLLVQLGHGDPLLQLAAAIPWQDFEKAFSIHYTEGIGAPKKPIRLWAIKIINRLNKLAKVHCLQQRRTDVKEVKHL